MNYQRQIDKLKARRQVALLKAEEERAALQTLQKRALAQAKAIVVAQTIAKTIQESAHDQIARIVTRCIQFVFGRSHAFQIEFVQKRNKTEAYFWFQVDGKRESPTEASSGGLLDVAAFGLRLAALVLHRPRLRRLLVLDEPFKHVSIEYRPAVRELIETLAEELDIQIVMVTHSRKLQIGKVVEF